MKFRHITAVSAMAAVFLFTQTWVFARENIPQTVDMIPAKNNKTVQEISSPAPDNLYSMSAVLMDGDSGRVLFDKDGDVPRPNASTTKVLTCIVALESAPGDDYVQISANAAAQPDVQLDLKEGEQYYLEDLLYSLMLKSHNDTAVAIAEHCGGSVEKFARMLNRKAEQIGCTDTYFITPNGLDAKDQVGVHHTTARDLALIMRYAIKNKTFLHIAQTRDYTFSDISGKRTFSLHNSNALLDMMDGVLAGKTGYTAQAGYCYVCAWEKDDRIFIVSILGCGWPGHKGYKWSDTKALLKYGSDNFFYQTYWQEPKTEKILVEDGVENNSDKKAYLRGKCTISESDKNKKVLIKKDEKVQMKVELPKTVKAPVRKGEKLGKISYYLDGKRIVSYPVYAEKSVEKISYKWYAKRVFHDFFH
ncbi:MAG: D-alanyl-D-alanine carboxypeptidase family protein [Blautia sp.]|nr:D-alanyl-D-alanine carboxypeptidase family protein [Blautia sp.]